MTSFSIPQNPHRHDHAVAMAKFSRNIVVKFNELVGQLETSLGPDTADLGIRVGLHSGPGTCHYLQHTQQIDNERCCHYKNILTNKSIPR
jgi:hypothetical protein